ncbi:unnamed protein product, partial [Porites lobata]
MARPPNCSLFVKNLHRETRSEDLRRLFARYGRITDVYIPLDYYTGESRGFAYVQYPFYIRGAEDAHHYLDGVMLLGRELEVQFAEGARKTPAQMRWKRRRRRRSHSRSRSSSPERRERSSPRSRYPERRQRSSREEREREKLSPSSSRVTLDTERRRRRFHSRSRSRTPERRERSSREERERAREERELSPLSSQVTLDAERRRRCSHSRSR